MELPEDSWSEAKKSVASALLIIHGICIAIVLFANVSPSGVQMRLVKTLAPYTRVLNWDPNFTRYHWTHGAPEHDDHRIVISQAGAAQADAAGADAAAEPKDPLVLQFGMRGTLRRARCQELAYFMAVYALDENDDITALVAKRVGEYGLRQLNATAGVRVRLENWDPPPLGIAAAPIATSPTDWKSRYSAEVSTAAGELLVIKDVPRGEVALPQGTQELSSP